MILVIAVAAVGVVVVAIVFVKKRRVTEKVSSVVTEIK